MEEILSIEAENLIKVVEFDHFKTQAGLPSFVLNVNEQYKNTKDE